VLAERFQQLVGSAPMQCLTQWRMLLATNLLHRSNAPLARIAENVGHQTDTAFIRAFRREYGASPAAWQRSRTSHAESSPLHKHRATRFASGWHLRIAHGRRRPCALR
jgi:AraC-like DNA-binding protein